MLKKFFLFLFIFNTVVLPVHAQETATITPVTKGQIVPYTGTLLSPKASADLTARLMLLQEQVKIEVDKTVAEMTASCDKDKQIIQAKLDTDAKVSQAKLDAKQKQLDLALKAEKEAESKVSTTKTITIISIAGSFVAGILGTILVVNAVK